MTIWISRIACTRAEADAVAAMDSPFDGHDLPPTLVATEVADGWELHLYTTGEPDEAVLLQLSGLAPSSASAPETEALADADWVALSQEGLQPVNAGRFHVHTGDHRGAHLPGQWPIRIDAGLAFGTGQHDTTRGCLIALQQIARRHRPRPDAMLDVGTGTGLLIFAGRHLFPRARMVASDVDKRATAVARANARRNGVPPGRIAFLTAFGIAHRGIARHGPYPLVVANILAGPLVAMAPSVALMVARGGLLLLAGLLDSQQQRLIAVYRNHGFQLVRASYGAEWPVLLLRRRKTGAAGTALRRARRGTAAEARRADSI